MLAAVKYDEKNYYGKKLIYLLLKLYQEKKLNTTVTNKLKGNTIELLQHVIVNYIRLLGEISMDRGSQLKQSFTTYDYHWKEHLDLLSQINYLQVVISLGLTIQIITTETTYSESYIPMFLLELYAKDIVNNHNLSVTEKQTILASLIDFIDKYGESLSSKGVQINKFLIKAEEIKLQKSIVSYASTITESAGSSSSSNSRFFPSISEIADASTSLTQSSDSGEAILK